MPHKRVHAGGRSAHLSVRGLPVLGLALACLALTPAAGEASLPGHNGLIAFTREGPPWDVNSPKTGAQTIWVGDPQSGRIRQLTHVPSRCTGSRKGTGWSDSSPSFSASGRLIAYIHVDELNCDRHTQEGVYLMRADGSGRRLLRPGGYGEPGARSLAFSPSGRQLAFDGHYQPIYVTSLETPLDEEALSGCTRIPGSGLDCLDARFEKYGSMGGPSWGATGVLALTLHGKYGFGGPYGHIATVTPSGTGLRLVTSSRRDSSPDWSPSADRITFLRNTVTTRPGPDSSFFLRERSDVLLARADGAGSPQHLTDTRDASAPIWSPDGRYIAYVRGDPQGRKRIWIMRSTDGGGQRRLFAKRLTVDGFFSLRISWQPVAIDAARQG